MRIITGSARGRRLIAPEGIDTRPTSEVTKEAVFSAIHFEVEGARMLDLFAGTGQMSTFAIRIRCAASHTAAVRWEGSCPSPRPAVRPKLPAWPFGS